MRTHVFLLGALLVVGCTSASNPGNGSGITPISNGEYTGVYISTPDEDYFIPCGVPGVGETLALDFRDSEPRAPFLNKITAIRGYGPLTHFIRVRGRVGPPGDYNGGFQTRQLVVDTLLDVKETTEPCPGRGVAAAWNALPVRVKDQRARALSRDLKMAALMDKDGQISIWSTETRTLVRKFAADNNSKSEATVGGPLVFSENAQLVATGGTDGIVRVLQTTDGKKLFSLALMDSAAAAAEQAKLPKRADGWVQIFPNSYTPVRDIVFNKRGTMLAASNYFSTMVWSLKTGQKLAEFKRGFVLYQKFFFVGDEGSITIGDSGRVALRSRIDANPVDLPTIRTRMTEALAISPDERWIAGRTYVDSIFVYSIATGATRKMQLPGFAMGPMAFSRDGKTLAVSGGAGGLYLWDTRTGAPLKSFHNFPSALTSVWFSPDGKSIVTLSNFDDRFRIVYVDPRARPSTQAIFDDSLTARLPLGPPISTGPRTVGVLVTGPKQRAVANAEVEIRNGDSPDSIIARTTTSPGGYASFPGIRFSHVLLRVRKAEFATGVKYVHLNRWDAEGPWSVELTPERSVESTGGL